VAAERSRAGVSRVKTHPLPVSTTSAVSEERGRKALPIEGNHSKAAQTGVNGSKCPSIQ
jgi:hypothetical protein